MNLVERTKYIINHFEFKFNKNFGQNFLIDEGALEKIVGEVNEGGLVIEIGPGIGTLTAAIAKKAKKVVSIEIDKRLIDVLKETLGNYDNIEIINDDALRVDIREILKSNGFDSLSIVANLPYNITTPMLMKLFDCSDIIDDMLLMVQREAGERIMSEPSNKEYGPLSVLSRYYFDVKKILRVPLSSFIPNPKVESSILKFKKRIDPIKRPIDEKTFINLVKTAFVLRRKTLNNVAKTLGVQSDKVNSLFLQSGIDGNRRGETLSVEEFINLSDAIYSKLRE